MIQSLIAQQVYLLKASTQRWATHLPQIGHPARSCVKTRGSFFTLTRPKKKIETDVFLGFVEPKLSARRSGDASQFHAGEHATHVSERPLHSRKRVRGINLIFEINKSHVLHALELLEDPRDRDPPLANTEC